MVDTANREKPPVDIAGEIPGKANPFPSAANENPGALAGATGADQKYTFTSEDYRMRAECATALALAIGDCHPDDACQLMVGALEHLSPDNTVGDVFLTAAEDAKWWAGIATPDQLAAVLAATLERLGDVPLHRKMRKRLFMKLWRSFLAEDQDRFLAHATAGR